MAESRLAEIETISTKVMVSKEGDPVEFIFISKQFSGPDADVIIISSDGVRFNLHKMNLALNTGGFPPLGPPTSPIVTTQEEANLHEKAHILDLLFRFIYPQRFPDVDNLKMSVLGELADAAEKYEVYNAIFACKMLMKFHKSTHPVDVFVYATQYGYLDLADDVAPLVLGTPASLLKDRLSANGLKAWVSYIASWETFRTQWTTSIIDAITSPHRHEDFGKAVNTCEMPNESKTLLKELSKSIMPETRLLSLARAVVCSRCKIPCIDKLIRDIPTQYAQFPKFQTFLR